MPAAIEESAVRKAANRLLDALDVLDEGCDKPGFNGWENGHGEPVGDEVQKARIALAHELQRK